MVHAKFALEFGTYVKISYRISFSIMMKRVSPFSRGGGITISHSDSSRDIGKILATGLGWSGWSKELAGVGNLCFLLVPISGDFPGNIPG